MELNIALGPFTFELAAGRLTREGASVPLGGRALAVLTALAEADGTVTKETLLNLAWPGVSVEEGNLTVQIAGLRKVLGDDTIVTVPRIGYRLRRQSPPPESELPRLAVLPFEIIGDPDQRYFADGVTEDVITALSRFRAFTVLSRHTAFARRDKSLADAAREFELAYVVTGSLQCSGQRLRLSAALVEGATGAQLWAEKYDGATADVFEFQDRVAEAVVGAVAPRVEAAEIRAALRHRPASTTAYDHYLRALAAFQAETAEHSAASVDLIERALAIEPDNPRYNTAAAWMYGHRVTMGRSGDPVGDRARQVDLMLAATRIAGDDARVLAQAAMTFIHTRRDYALGMELVQRAREANPNDALVLAWAAIGHLHCGDMGECVRLARRSVALGRSDSSAAFAVCALAHAAVVEGRLEVAIEAARQALALRTGFPATLWMLTAAHALLGRREEARHWLAALRALTPHTSVGAIRDSQPRMMPERIDPVLAGLQLAGLPEG
jgi:TolB-like protein